jgi:hypothetical protein
MDSFMASENDAGDYDLDKMMQEREEWQKRIAE